MSVLAPPILVSPGTLVPPTVSLEKFPGWLRAPLCLPHKLGIGPSPDRFLVDIAYGRLKELRRCWVVPLSRLGLDNREVSIEIAKARLRMLIRKYPETRVILVGQSQGGLIVSELALDSEFAPNIAVCVMVCTPFKGAPITRGRLLGWSTAFPGVAQMVPGHKSLEQLCWRIGTGWPEHILPVVVGSKHDELVPPESAFGVEFPAGVEPRTFEIEEAGWGTTHVLMCRHPKLISLVRKLRREFTSNRLQSVAA